MTTDRKTVSHDRRARVAHGIGAAVGAFIVATLALSVGVYMMGFEEMAHPALSVDEMSVFKVTSAAAFGVASAVMSFVLGLVGIVTAAGAAVIGLAAGALGIAGAAIVTVGVVTGPLLMLAAIGMVIKRRFFPDVI